MNVQRAWAWGTSKTPCGWVKRKIKNLPNNWRKCILLIRNNNANKTARRFFCCYSAKYIGGLLDLDILWLDEKKMCLTFHKRKFYENKSKQKFGAKCSAKCHFYLIVKTMVFINYSLKLQLKTEKNLSNSNMNLNEIHKHLNWTQLLTFKIQ